MVGKEVKYVEGRGGGGVQGGVSGAGEGGAVFRGKRVLKKKFLVEFFF